MGGIIKAICKCGFESDFMAGSSASNYNEACSAPAICYTCKKLVVKNYLLDDLTCPACNNQVIFYNHKSLQNPGKNGVLTNSQTRDFTLPEVNCLCPKCGKKEMMFLHTGCWD
jgi:predicted RNA-binding Zn-ribbon protein involved in translation (DUF1610 family)